MSNISPILSTNLNTSSLPPVFQIPQKIPKNNKSNNILPVTYMNNSSYDNPVFKIRGKPLLKPINMNETRKKISRNHNISDVNFNYSEINKNKSPEKFSKTSQYYFQMMQNIKT